MKGGEKAEGMCYRELLAMGIRLLGESGVPDADIDGFLLLERVSGMDRAKFFLNGGETAPPAEVRRYRELLSRRAERIPLQYILGEQEFMGLSFFVNQHVLVPRQDTECLVELALPCVGGKRVLDLCTGSGCIAISLAVHGYPAGCCGADISADALSVARENARRNRAEVEFIESDLFACVEGEYDVVVSNPPYIPRRVIEGLEEEVRSHEPRLALDGGEDGLDFYRRITDGCRRHLREGGMLFYEIGGGQAEDVMKILGDAGFCDISCHRDYAGNDRVVQGRFLGTAVAR